MNTSNPNMSAARPYNVSLLYLKCGLGYLIFRYLITRQAINKQATMIAMMM